MSATSSYINCIREDATANLQIGVRVCVCVCVCVGVHVGVCLSVYVCVLECESFNLISSQKLDT